MADAIANVYNTCGFDQIYCDGAEGMRSAYGTAAMRDKIIGVSEYCDAVIEKYQDLINGR